MGSTVDSSDIVKPVIKGVKFNFGVGQKILCKHQHQLYESKVLKAELRQGVPQYFVHYQGWNKKWDEWVTDERILDYNDDNLIKAEEMMKAGKQKSQKGGQKRKSQSNKTVIATDSDSQTSIKIEKDDDESPAKKASADTTPTTPKTAAPASPASNTSSKDESPSVTKKSTDNSTTTTTPISASTTPTTPAASSKATPKQAKTKQPVIIEEEPEEEKLELLEINLPKELQDALLDDWHFVEVKNMLVHIPASITVDRVLRAYIDERISKNFKTTDSRHLNKLGDWIDEWSFREVAMGIKKNFNHIFGSSVLYRIERLQYAEILKVIENENRAEAKKHPESVTSKKSRTARQLSIDELANRDTIEYDFTTKYAPIHLLRAILQFDHIFTKDLPTVIQEITLEFLQDFLDFLNEHRQEYFSTDQYYTPPQEYSRKALAN